MNLHFGAKKIYLTKIIFQVRFKQATVNNSGGKETRHASHRNFWNLSTKVDGVERKKLGPISHIGGVRSIYHPKLSRSHFQSIFIKVPPSL